MGRLRIENGNIYNDDYMSFNECLDVIKEFSYSQGFYGRLLETIEELDDTQKEQLKEELENKKFTNNIDFIEYIETIYIKKYIQHLKD